MKQPIPQARQGLLLGLSAYVIWGLAPIFFKLLSQIPTYEIIAHRVIWSLFFIIIIVSFSPSGWKNIIHIGKSPKTLFSLLLSSLLIVSNWTIYIWSVTNDHLLEASLGYFICPLASILLAIIVLKERFRPFQWLALSLAAIGILVQLWVFGSIPKVALGLALSFSLYGLFRKKIAVDAMSGLFFETLWLLPGALFYLYFMAKGSATSNIINNSIGLNLLLLSCGIITTIPLILFNAAAVRVKLSTLGLIQYIGPTSTFFLAVFVYHETVNQDKMITFLFIWVGLAIFIWDSFRASKNNKLNHASSSQNKEP